MVTLQYKMHDGSLKPASPKLDYHDGDMLLNAVAEWALWWEHAAPEGYTAPYEALYVDGKPAFTKEQWDRVGVLYMSIYIDHDASEEEKQEFTELCELVSRSNDG